MKKDKRIDQHIQKAAPFAQPVLKHLRELIHKVCPDVEETTKWGFPHFEYKGSILCSMAAFKQHCVFGFWKASLMDDPDHIFDGGESAGNLGQIKNLKDLPADKILTKYIKQAMQLNEEGVKVEKKTKTLPGSKEIKAPDDFMKAIAKNKKALATFEKFSYTNKKEYIDWITGAKSEETRNKRRETAVEWMAEGKIRHWKYAR